MVLPVSIDSLLVLTVLVKLYTTNYRGGSAMLIVFRYDFCSMVLLVELPTWDLCQHININLELGIMFEMLKFSFIFH